VTWHWFGGCHSSDEDEEEGHIHWSSLGNRVPGADIGRLDLTKLSATIQILEIDW